MTAASWRSPAAAMWICANNRKTAGMHSASRRFSVSKKYSLMKKKSPPVSMFLGKRQPLLWYGFCRAEDYAAQTKGRAGKVLGGRLCGGSRSGQRLPSRFFATFLAGTRKVGPRSDRHQQFRRECGRLTLKSTKKSRKSISRISKTLFIGACYFLVFEQESNQRNRPGGALTAAAPASEPPPPGPFPGAHFRECTMRFYLL